MTQRQSLRDLLLDELGEARLPARAFGHSSLLVADQIFVNVTSDHIEVWIYGYGHDVLFRARWCEPDGVERLVRELRRLLDDRQTASRDTRESLSDIGYQNSLCEMNESETAWSVVIREDRQRLFVDIFGDHYDLFVPAERGVVFSAAWADPDGLGRLMVEIERRIPARC